LGFFCEFGGNVRGGLWMEESRGKNREIFHIFLEYFYLFVYHDLFVHSIRSTSIVLV
jgi:hypothetical protein